jgi:hypothetical protein
MTPEYLVFITTHSIATVALVIVVTARIVQVQRQEGRWL